MEFTEEARNENIKLSLLDPDDVFIFDTQVESKSSPNKNNNNVHHKK